MLFCTAGMASRYERSVAILRADGGIFDVIAIAFRVALEICFKSKKIYLL